MNVMFGGDESLQDRAAITDRIVSDARRLYRDLADDDALERSARRAVAEVWPGSIKVTSFVSVLALRRLREMLAEEDGHRNVGLRLEIATTTGTV